jgi:hypothetical protein
MVGRRELPIPAMVDRRELPVSALSTRSYLLRSGRCRQLRGRRCGGDRLLDAVAAGAEALKLSTQSLEVAPLPGA